MYRYKNASDAARAAFFSSPNSARVVDDRASINL
jgi:hypothetical protein